MPFFVLFCSDLNGCLIEIDEVELIVRGLKTEDGNEGDVVEWKEMNQFAYLISLQSTISERLD